MNTEDRRKIVLDRAKELLRPDGTGKGYICPICNSGSGNRGTGITENRKSPNHYTCWAGNCFTNADILEIVGVQYGLNDYTEQLAKCEELLNITTNEYREKPKTVTKEKSAEVPIADFTEQYKKWAEDLDKTNYLTSRGISKETAKAFMLGYNAAEERLIIPVSKSYYKGRATTPKSEAYGKYKNPTGQKINLLNLDKVLTEQNGVEPVFIVEGELDAISFYEVGAQAIALSSTANTNLLLEALKQHPVNRTFILALDNDEAGNIATDKLKKGLEELKISYTVADMYTPYKDANEYLVANKEEFRKAVKISKNKKKQEYIEKNTNKGKLQDFINGITDSVNTKVIKTGFSNLDTILESGLKKGLYIMGAISSIGKTTFLVQLTDQLAKQGVPVLYVSLEQSADELIAKSISRETLEITIENNLPQAIAKTSVGITTAERWKNYSESEINVIKEAMTRYEKYADKIEVLQGTINTSAVDIMNKVKEFKDSIGIAPVVIVDYLQLLSPIEKGYTDKMNVDKNLQALVQLSRDYKTSVILISSLNRESYRNAKTNDRKGAIEKADFKDSGNIEYSADVLLGMQFATAGNSGVYNERKELANKIRDIEIVVLKQRNGRTGVGACFKYHTLFNTFEEQGINDGTQEE